MKPIKKYQLQKILKQKSKKDCELYNDDNDATRIYEFTDIPYV